MEKEEYFENDLLNKYPINVENDDDEEIELRIPDDMKSKAFEAYKVEPRFWSLEHL